MKLTPENPPLFVLCDCKNPEHQLVLTADVDKEWGSFISVETHLTTYRNIFKRVWVAVKYVFGHRSKYGEWDDVLIDPTEAERIRDYINKFLDEDGR